MPPTRADKEGARDRLSLFITVIEHISVLPYLPNWLIWTQDKQPDRLPQPGRLAVRVNAVDTAFFQGDIEQAVSVLLALKSSMSDSIIQLALSCIRTLVIPKVHSTQELDVVSKQIRTANSRKATPDPVNIVASIESARALYNVGQIASWRSKFGPVLGGRLTALLVRVDSHKKALSYS